jgi:hypothetical protein
MEYVVREVKMVLDMEDRMYCGRKDVMVMDQGRPQ